MKLPSSFSQGAWSVVSILSFFFFLSAPYSAYAVDVTGPFKVARGNVLGSCDHEGRLNSIFVLRRLSDFNVAEIPLLTEARRRNNGHGPICG